MPANILGGGPGGSGLRTTSTFRGRNIGAKQRAISQALQGGFRRDWQRISRELQEVVVEETKTGLARPEASTGRLSAITASPRNRSATDDSFAVGIISYLDRPTQKKQNYPLAIEFGTDAHVGQRLTGVWISGGQFRPFGNPRPGDQFRSMRARTARRLLDVPGPVTGYIQVPIEPHRDYSTAWRKYNPRAQILAAVNRNLRPR